MRSGAWTGLVPGQLWPATLVAAALSGCGGPRAESGLAVPAIETLPGGTVQVTNAGPTQWADTNGWRIVEEAILQPAEGSPGEFSDVTKLVADSRGNVFVMQIQPTVIKAFDSTGAWLRDIGRQGNGPGEFPDGMLAIVGDTLLVQDPNNARLTAFLTDGTLLRTSPSQCCFFTSALPALDAGAVLVMGNPPAGHEASRRSYYVTRPDGTVLDTLIPAVATGGRAPGSFWSVRVPTPRGGMQLDVPVPGVPRDQDTWRGDGVLVSGNTGEYRLAIRRGYRDTSRVVLTSVARQMLTADARDSLFEEVLLEQPAEFREAIRSSASVDQIPLARPKWTALATDRAHRIWVGIPGPGTDVAVLHVYSPEGVLLAAVPAPHPRILEGFWTRDRIYLRDVDASGAPLVRIFRLRM